MARVSPDIFSTRAHEQLLAARAAGEMALDRLCGAAGRNSKNGTVGAVARDKFGNLAAATSTGGMTNKLPGAT